MITVVSRAGGLSQLGEALAHYGRIFKTLHVLSFVVDEPYYTFTLPDLGGHPATTPRPPCTIRT